MPSLRSRQDKPYQGWETDGIGYAAVRARKNTEKRFGRMTRPRNVCPLPDHAWWFAFRRLGYSKPRRQQTACRRELATPRVVVPDGRRFLNNAPTKVAFRPGAALQDPRSAQIWTVSSHYKKRVGSEKTARRRTSLRCPVPAANRMIVPTAAAGTSVGSTVECRKCDVDNTIGAV